MTTKKKDRIVPLRDRQASHLQLAAVKHLRNHQGVTTPPPLHAVIAAAVEEAAIVAAETVDVVAADGTARDAMASRERHRATHLLRQMHHKIRARWEEEGSALIPSSSRRSRSHSNNSASSSSRKYSHPVATNNKVSQPNSSSHTPTACRRSPGAVLRYQVVRLSTRRSLDSSNNINHNSHSRVNNSNGHHQQT